MTITAALSLSPANIVSSFFCFLEKDQWILLGGPVKREYRDSFFFFLKTQVQTLKPQKRKGSSEFRVQSSDFLTPMHCPGLHPPLFSPAAAYRFPLSDAWAEHEKEADWSCGSNRNCRVARLPIPCTSPKSMHQNCWLLGFGRIEPRISC